MKVPFTTTIYRVSVFTGVSVRSVKRFNGSRQIYFYKMELTEIIKMELQNK